MILQNRKSLLEISKIEVFSSVDSKGAIKFLAYIFRDLYSKPLKNVWVKRIVFLSTNPYNKTAIKIYPFQISSSNVP